MQGLIIVHFDYWKLEILYEYFIDFMVFHQL